MAKTQKTPKQSRYQESFAGIARRACRLFGCNDAEISEIFGVKTRTITRWKTKNPTFANSLELGRNEFALRIPRSTARQIETEQLKRQRLIQEKKKLIKGLRNE